MSGTENEAGLHVAFRHGVPLAHRFIVTLYKVAYTVATHDTENNLALWPSSASLSQMGSSASKIVLARQFSKMNVTSTVQCHII